MCLRYLSPVTNNKDPALSFVEGGVHVCRGRTTGGFWNTPMRKRGRWEKWMQNIDAKS